MLVWGCRRAPPRNPGTSFDTRLIAWRGARRLREIEAGPSDLCPGARACGKNLPRRPYHRATGKETEGSTVPAVRLPAGAASRSTLADQRGLCCPTRLATRKPRALSAPSRGRLRVRAAWHLLAEPADGDADYAVLLSHGPRNLQPPS